MHSMVRGMPEHRLNRHLGSRSVWGEAGVVAVSNEEQIMGLANMKDNGVCRAEIVGGANHTWTGS
jgi:hypothetical protein